MSTEKNYFFNEEDTTKREMIEQIRSDYKMLFAAFSPNGKLSILFENVEEEERFKQEYRDSLNFITILRAGSIKVYKYEQ